MEVALQALKSDVLINKLRRFIRKNARSKIINLLYRIRFEDLAQIVPKLSPTERTYIFKILVSELPQAAAYVLTELEPYLIQEILSNLSREEILDIITTLPLDDAVFIVENFPEDTREEIIELADKRLGGRLKAHLHYEEGSAGRVMTPEYIALNENSSVKEAIEKVRKAASESTELVLYLYVIDNNNKLVGVLSLRQLLLADPEKRLKDIMNPNVIKVTPSTSEEEVAQLAAKYDLLAIPVIDDNNHLIGIVTVDDIIDILREQATEDFLRLAGTSSEEFLYKDQPLKIALVRLPWLLFTIVSSTLSGILLSWFDNTFDTALLLTFVPVIMAMGGNVAGQTSTITVRALATGKLQLSREEIKKYILRQIKIGIIIAFIASITAAIIAIIQNGKLIYAPSIGLALFIAILWSSVTGTCIPLIFKKVGIDPAIASGPLLSTLNDITGIIIYFLTVYLIVK